MAHRESRHVHRIGLGIHLNRQRRQRAGTPVVDACGDDLVLDLLNRGLQRRQYIVNEIAVRDARGLTSHRRVADGVPIEQHVRVGDELDVDRFAAAERHFGWARDREGRLDQHREGLGCAFAVAVDARRGDAVDDHLVHLRSVHEDIGNEVSASAKQGFPGHVRVVDGDEPLEGARHVRGQQGIHGSVAAHFHGSQGIEDHIRHDFHHRVDGRAFTAVGHRSRRHLVRDVLRLRGRVVQRVGDLVGALHCKLLIFNAVVRNGHPFIGAGQIAANAQLHAFIVANRQRRERIHLRQRVDQNLQHICRIRTADAIPRARHLQRVLNGVEQHWRLPRRSEGTGDRRKRSPRIRLRQPLVGQIPIPRGLHIRLQRLRLLARANALVLQNSPRVHPIHVNAGQIRNNVAAPSNVKADDAVIPNQPGRIRRRRVRAAGRARNELTIGRAARHAAEPLVTRGARAVLVGYGQIQGLLTHAQRLGQRLLRERRRLGGLDGGRIADDLTVRPGLRNHDSVVHDAHDVHGRFVFNVIGPRDVLPRARRAGRGLPLETERPRAAAHLNEQSRYRRSELAVRGIDRLHVDDRILHHNHFSGRGGGHIATAAAQRHFRVVFERARGVEGRRQVGGVVAVRDGRSIDEPFIGRIARAFAVFNLEVKVKRSAHAKRIAGEWLKRDDGIWDDVHLAGLGYDFVAAAALECDDAVVIKRADRIRRRGVARARGAGDGRSGVGVIGRRCVPLIFRGARSVFVVHFKRKEGSVQTHFLIKRLEDELRRFGGDDFGRLADDRAVRPRLDDHAPVVHGAHYIDGRQVTDARCAGDVGPWSQPVR